MYIVYPYANKLPTLDTCAQLSLPMMFGYSACSPVALPGACCVCGRHHMHHVDTIQRDSSQRMDMHIGANPRKCSRGGLDLDLAPDRQRNRAHTHTKRCDVFNEGESLTTGGAVTASFGFPLPPSPPL